MLTCNFHRILPIGISLNPEGYYDANPKVQSFHLARHDIGHGGDYECNVCLYSYFRINKNDIYFENKQKALSKTLGIIRKFTPFYNSLYERGISLKDSNLRRDA